MSFMLSFFVFFCHGATLKELGALKAPFELPKLSYELSDLEPVIDTETMKLHFEKHHQAYIKNLNDAVGANKVDLGQLLKTVSSQGDKVRNNGGGHWNHAFFWTVLKPVAENKAMPAALKRELSRNFGSVAKFKEQFEKAGLSLFGSGWVWLVQNDKGKLQIVSTSNQDNPLMDVVPQATGKPILGIDVWEHAYYIKHKNKRADYLKDLWQIIDWEQVESYRLEVL